MKKLFFVCLALSMACWSMPANADVVFFESFEGGADDASSPFVNSWTVVESVPDGISSFDVVALIATEGTEYGYLGGGNAASGNASILTTGWDATNTVDVSFDWANTFASGQGFTLNLYDGTASKDPVFASFSL